MIGLDAIALSPKELGRGQDENGQLMIWRSLISNQVLVSGSRKTGSAAAIKREADQRSYVILEEGNQPVNLLRTAVRNLNVMIIVIWEQRIPEIFLSSART